MAVLGLVLVLVLVADLIGPELVSRFIDRATGESVVPDQTSHAQALQVLLWLAGGFVLTSVLSQILAVVRAVLGAKIAWRATNRLREETVSHCLDLDLAFHQDHGAGEMVERVDGDIRELNNFFAEFALQILSNILLIIGVLVVVFFVDFRLGFAFVGLCLVAVLVFHRIRGKASPLWIRARQANADLYGQVEDRFSGIPDIRANGATSYVLHHFARLLRDQFRRTRSAITMSIGLSQTAMMVLGLGGGAILALSARLYLSGMISLGTVVQVVLYLGLISAPLKIIVDQIDDLQSATASVERVQGLMDRRPTVLSGPGVRWPSGPLSLSVDHVTFSYPSTDSEPAAKNGPAIEDIHFELQPGQVLGVVGRTGAGKSTLMRLMLRLYDPQQGSIRVAGEDLRSATLAQLRDRVGVVTQEIDLFQATVRDNLSLFDADIDDGRIVSAITDVGLGRWLDRQELGLDTVLDSSGGGLSAGEQQLLGVARLFLLDPGLVILDEPTSRLDPVTEQALDLALDRLLAGRTTVIVAHRIRTLDRADSIAMMSNGRIVEFGRRADLVDDRNSLFSHTLDRGLSEVLG